MDLITKSGSLLRFLLSLCWVAAIRLSMAVRSEYAQKTVESEYGDIYDCIDFYKQPAFDHPLLKNHSFHPQMKPTSVPQRINNSESTWKINATETNISRLKDGGCPEGTVPIRRVNKSSGLSDTKGHPQQSFTAEKPNGPAEFISGNIFAISQTISDPSKVYNGLGAVVSVYNPRVFPSQYSSAEIILRGGTDFIIAGWTVNPNKYPGDRRTRFFVYIGAGNMHCFNTECGFVVTSKDTPVDFVLDPVSKRREKIYEQKFFIHRDASTGVWWLQVGIKQPAIALGFWPQNIFVGLQQPATYAACGGEAYTTATVPPPEMGAGWFPDMDPNIQIDAYCRDFNVVDNNGAIVDAKQTATYKTHEYYGVADKHMYYGQHVIAFGGPN